MGNACRLCPVKESVVAQGEWLASVQVIQPGPEALLAVVLALRTVEVGQQHPRGDMIRILGDHRLVLGDGPIGRARRAVRAAYFEPAHQSWNQATLRGPASTWQNRQSLFVATWLPKRMNRP